jgi:hypothetical protein
MAKVTVHSFKVWDPPAGRYFIQSLKSPAERIAQIKRAEIMPGTAEDVDESELDEHGRFDPKKRRDDPDAEGL